MGFLFGSMQRPRRRGAEEQQAMEATVIIGGQWGDEGKAKVVDFLMPGHDLVVRFQGGANAGHTVVSDAGKFAFH